MDEKQLNPETTQQPQMAETGRPSMYTVHADEIDNLVLECGAAGYSLAQIAAVIGISINTMRNWMRDVPRFAAVVDIARTRSQAWWEGRAMDGTANDLIGPSVWAKSVAARFPADYTDRQEQGGIGDGGKIEKIKWEVVDPPEREGGG